MQLNRLAALGMRGVGVLFAMAWTGFGWASPTSAAFTGSLYRAPVDLTCPLPAVPR
jgi:hypothetical protein